MNIRLARDNASLLFPATISYGAAAEVAEREAAAARHASARAGRAGLARRVGRALAWIAELPHRHSVLSQLEGMTDRELADIGLSRANLSQVFRTDAAA